MSDDIKKLSDRELDALVQVEVFGPWPDTHCPICGWQFGARPCDCHPGDCSLRPGPSRRADEPAYFSTDPAASKYLRDRMRQLGWNYRIYTYRTPTPGVHAEFTANEATPQ